MVKVINLPISVMQNQVCFAYRYPLPSLPSLFGGDPLEGIRMFHQPVFYALLIIDNNIGVICVLFKAYFVHSDFAPGVAEG